MAKPEMKIVNRMGVAAERHVPVAQVSFHTEEKLYQIRGISKGFGGQYDPTDQLLSVTTNKTMDAPAGTFSISLVGDHWFMRDGETVLKPNDLVVIYMGYKSKSKTVLWVDNTSHTDSEDLDTVMIGLVDTVTRTRNGGGNNGVPNVQTTVQGRDFGKLLIKAMLRFYPELGWTNDKEQKFFLTEQGWITLMKAFTNDNTIKGAPAEILDTVMRFILKQIMDIQWKIYDESPFQTMPTAKTVGIMNMLRYVFAKTNFFIPFFMSAQQYEGSLWNMMGRVNLKPFTEMFVDTRDRWEVMNGDGIPQLVNETIEKSNTTPAPMFGKKDGAQAVLVYRNTPFDRSSWDKLRKHTLDEIDIHQETLSYSDNENYNLFWAGTTLTPFSNLDLKRVQPPLMNEDNVKRYGLNPLEVQVEGLELDVSKDYDQKIALEGLTRNLNAKLKAWYQDSIKYLSGSMEVRGRGSYKIGQRLVHKSMGYEFYIEGVTQNFQVFGGWSTSMNVTRGMKPPFPNAEDSMQSTITAHSTAPEEIPDPPKAPPAANFYTVESGDTLWSIAYSKLGSSDRWTELWDANKDMLIERDSRNATDPGRWIFVGQQLRIP